MDLIILAGGSGTRIQAISQGTPKALLPVGEKVFLDKILSNIARLDSNHIYLSLHYKPGLFREYLTCSDYKEKITKIINESILIVAHPDDEVLWASSVLNSVNKIIICFSNQHDKDSIITSGRKVLHNACI